MIKYRHLIICIGCIIALLASACAGGSKYNGGDKIAVVNWEKAVAQHPQYKKLKQGEAVHADLVKKRREQEALAKAQMSSLDKLHDLKELSEKSYLTADYNTRMFEQQARENAKLKVQLAKAEAEADAQLADRRKAAEDEFQLRIFNLRARLEMVKMRPAERQATEAELREVQLERGEKIHQLDAEKQAIITAKMKPYMDGIHQRMQQRAAELQQNISQKLETSAAKYDNMLSGAPEALQNALAIMDREIDKQQEKNDKLSEAISSDITSIAAKLAHERGYTIIFNQYKANAAADDITEDIIKELQKQNK